MTNYDKWQSYTSGLPSPQNYIDWTWRYIICASLQRRVWLPPEHNPCFANMYQILVGKAGLGKGLCITVATDFLRHWKLKDAARLLKKNGRSEEHVQSAETVLDVDIKNAQEAEMQVKNKRAEIIEPYLIPIAADATTYEALVESVAKSYRRVAYEAYDDKQQKNRLFYYGHSSVCFSLPELASLLRKRTEDTVNYMLGLYDCPTDYEYNTKHMGKDRVRRGCLNLLAGTTPNFMQQIFNEKLIDQGFGSRTLFIYANKDRKTQFWIPELTAEQKVYKEELLQHVLQLTSLYGPVRMDDSTRKFLEDWWCKVADGSKNKSPKLEGYYSRKKVHVMKVAMANHFSESLELYVPQFRFEESIETLDKEEKNMHLAITIEGENHLAKVSKKLLEFISDGPKDFVQLTVELWGIANSKELEDTITFLKDTNQISVGQKEDEDTKEVKLYYQLK